MERETVRVVESLQSVPGKRPRNSKYSTEARSKRKLVSSSAIREKKKKKTVKSKLFESYRCSPLPPWTLISRSIDRSIVWRREINKLGSGTDRGTTRARRCLLVLHTRARARSYAKKCREENEEEEAGSSRFPTSKIFFSGISISMVEGDGVAMENDCRRG